MENQDKKHLKFKDLSPMLESVEKEFKKIKKWKISKNKPN